MVRNGEPAGLHTRALAIAKLQTVLKGDQFVPLNVHDVADARDRAFANRLVTVGLRRHQHINKIIGEVLERGLPPRSGRFEATLRIALTELLFLPDQPDHSALFLAVEAIKKDKRSQHLAKLMNGVLRGVQRDADHYRDQPIGNLFPNWLAGRWAKYYGADVMAKFGEAMLEGASLDLTLRDEDADLISELNAQKIIGDSVRVETRDRSVSDLPGYDEGRWWVQDMTSAMPARLMGLPKGAKVLDMCAAPGGKTAQLVKSFYDVTALDVEELRLQRVKENLARLGYNAKLAADDGARYRPDAAFDGVLVDAPCSSTGTFRRHPEVLLLRGKEDIHGRVGLQRQLLVNAVKCLKPGGVLIYSTCSLERDEGEDQARWLLQQEVGVENFPIVGNEVEGFEEAISSEGWLRMHPGMTAPGILGGSMDGFFVARFRYLGPKE